MDLMLKGKTALVAAASKGLGYGVARALAAEGAQLAICSRTSDEIEAAAARLRTEFGVPVQAAVCDMARAADIAAWVEGAVRAYGRIDALLVNAGGPPAAYFKEIDDAGWQAAFELTLLSTVRLIRAALPHMPPGSAVLTITSSTIIEPIERLGLSAVMRAGVMALVKTLADELAADGVRVNNLLPGRIDTDRVVHLDRLTAERRGLSLEAVREESAARIPLRRLGTIDEFGAAAAFLLSPAAAYITGAMLRVDGGAMRSI